MGLVGSIVAEIGRQAGGLLDSAFSPAIRTPAIFSDVLNLEKTLGQDVGGVSLEVFGELRELIELQIQMQQELQAITMASNVERSRHEAKMAPIRNIRTT